MISARKKLILHAGLPKTATSAIQYWFRINRDAMKEFGVAYPYPLGKQNDKHSFLVQELLSQPALPVLSKLLSGESLPGIVLSNEGLSNHLDDFTASALANFRAITSGMDVLVILVTRARQPWLKSYHKQCVLNPRNGSSPLWGTGLTSDEIADIPRIQRLLDHDRLLADLGTAYGANQTLHLCYDEEGWFLRMLEVIGLTDMKNLPLPRVNESIPEWAIETLRRINLAVNDNTERMRWLAAVQIYLNSTNSNLASAADQYIKANNFPVLDTSVLDVISASNNSDEFHGFSAFVTNQIGSLE
jgi:hypothetical protein